MIKKEDIGYYVLAAVLLFFVAANVVRCNGVSIETQHPLTDEERKALYGD